MTLLTTIWRARRAGLLRLRPADKPLRLDCKGGECGLCCEVTGGGVIVTESEALRLPAQTLQRQGRVIVIKSDKGACCLLRNTICTAYADRPQGCREYPFYNLGGRLYYDFGCPGIRYDSDGQPPVASISPAERFFSELGSIRKRLVIWILRMW